jgi:hypothetical protein
MSAAPKQRDLPTFDADFPRLAPIELCHALDLAEGHVVAIFQTMPRLVRSGDNGLFRVLLVLVDADDHALHWLFACRVDARELRAEIAEDGGEEAADIRRDEVDASSVGVVVDLELLRHGRVGQHNDLRWRSAGSSRLRETDLKLGDGILVELAFEHRDGHISVELRYARKGGSISRLTNVGLAQEELGPQIGHFDGRRVVQRDGLDASQADVLGCDAA